MDFLINNINTIITITIFVCLGLAAVWGIAWGIKRGTLRSTTRLLTYVLSAGFAFVAVIILAETLLPVVEPKIKTTVVDFLVGVSADVAELVNSSSDLVNYILELVTALITPLLFVVLFGIFLLLSYPAFWIATKFLPRKDERVTPVSRIGGAVVSLAGAFLMAICFLMPVTGYVAYAAETYPTVMEAGVVPEGSVPETVDKQVLAAKKNPGVNVINACGGKLIFSMMTRVEDSSATDELTNIIITVKDALPAFKNLMEDNAGVAEGEAVLNLDAVEEIILPALDKTSPRLKGIFVDVLHTGAGKLKNGETFLGLNIEDMFGEYAGTADTLLDKLINTTADTVSNDLGAVSESMVLLSRTYVYLIDVSDRDIPTEELKESITGILTDLTPETAEILKDTITDDFLSSANIGSESSHTVATIVGSTLTDIAAIEDPEQKKKEAEAINQLVNYASSSRTDQVAPDDVVSTVLESEVLSNKVEELVDANTATGEEQKLIEVSATQKQQIDNYIDDMIAASQDPDALEEDQLTEEQIKILEAIKQLVSVRGGK